MRTDVQPRILHAAPDAIVLIRAPAEEVFGYLADIPRHAEWSPVDARQETSPLTTGAVGVGSRYRTTAMLGGRSVVSEAEIVAYDPPHTLAIEQVAIDGEPELCTRTDYRVRPYGDGCLVEVRSRPLGTSNLPSLVALQMRTLEGESLDLLREHFEGSSPSDEDEDIDGSIPQPPAPNVDRNAGQPVTLAAGDRYKLGYSVGRAPSAEDAYVISDDKEPDQRYPMNGDGWDDAWFRFADLESNAAEEYAHEFWGDPLLEEFEDELFT